MNTTPIQPEPNEREELARLLPGPVERDLPSDRHQRLQEFVMSQIHQDLRSTEQAPRRMPKRRPVFLASALTAVAVAATAVAFVGRNTGPTAPPTAQPFAQPTASQPQELTGSQILLVAATSAAEQTAGSGKYWHIRGIDELSLKRLPEPHSVTYETWVNSSGRSWYGVAANQRNGKGTLNSSNWGGFDFSDEDVLTMAQIKALPTDPKSLMVWARGLKMSNFRGDHNAVSPKEIKRYTEFGTAQALIHLLATAPAAPKVRSAAYRALATIDQVKFIGETKDSQGRTGQGFTIGGEEYIIDAKTSLVLSTTAGSPAMGRTRSNVLLEVGWTDTAPRIPAK
jgi:hypothetical protein